MRKEYANECINVGQEVHIMQMDRVLDGSKTMRWMRYPLQLLLKRVVVVNTWSGGKFTKNNDLVSHGIKCNKKCVGALLSTSCNNICTPSFEVSPLGVLPRMRGWFAW